MLCCLADDDSADDFAGGGKAKGASHGGGGAESRSAVERSGASWFGFGGARAVGPWIVWELW